MPQPIIIVTGASRGIAEELQARGAVVVGAARKVADLPATDGLFPVAAEWGPDGVRVNAVLPWFTRTEMIAKVLEDRVFEEKLLAATPLGRPAEPADIVRAA